MQALVSVVITSFNRCELLKRALQSVLDQTYTTVEIIVVDDASSDSTLVFMEQVVREHKNVKYLRNTVNCGSNFCRNYGIKQASGFFIAGLDDDDEFHPHRIQKLVSKYDAKFAFITSLNEKVTRNSVNYSACKPVVTINDLLLSNCLMNQGLIERERIISVGLYDETLSACQDYDIWIRLCDAYGDVKVVQEYLQTIYDNSNIQRISNNGHKTFTGYLGFYRKYKKKLSTVQRQNMLFSIYRVRGKPLALWSFKSLLSSENEVALINFYKDNNAPLYDYFSVQNVTKKITALDKNQSYILYGCGTLGKLAMLYLQDSIVAVIDEGLQKQGKSFISNIPLIDLNELSVNPELRDLIVLITPINHFEIIQAELKSRQLKGVALI